MGQIVNLSTARTLVARYVCARCYHPLIATDPRDGTRNMLVSCSNPDCNGQGFVTRSYAERRRSESSAEYMEAYHNLAGALGLKKKNRSEKEICQDLGV